MESELKKIIAKIEFNYTKDQIIRYLYIKLAPLFKRDLTYFLASDEDKRKMFKEGFSNKLPYVVCVTLVDFYIDLFKHFNIEAQIINSTNKGIPLYTLAVLGDYGWYYLDPLNDLFRNQYGLKPIYFGIMPTFKGVERNIEFAVLSDAYLKSIDDSLQLQPYNMFLDEYIEEIHQTFAVRSKVAKYFGLKIKDDIGIMEKKIAFYNEHIINLGNVNCPFERNRLYSYLNGRLFDKSERRNINVTLEGEVNNPYIIFKAYDEIYVEENANQQYELRRVK